MTVSTLLRLRFVRGAGGLLAGAALLLGGALAVAAPDRDLADRLRERLAAQRAGVPLEAVGERLRHAAELQDLYAGRFYEPVWFRDGRLTGQAEAVAGLLASASQDGLRPADYRADALADALAGAMAALDTASTAARAELELALTDAVVAYTSDILLGRVRPERLFPSWESPPRDVDLSKRASALLASQDPVKMLWGLAPGHRHYQRLRELLARLRGIERAGGWVPVPPGPALKPGLRSERVAALRRRLAQSRDWTADVQPAEPNVVDGELEAAVRRYQARHGLEPDGVAGAATIESLNTPVSRRIRTIELNMERWRWLPRDLGSRYITVNIAGFELTLVEHNEPQLTMPVVVGRPYRATPVFTGLMTYLVFSPYWNVPPGIARQDILPKVKENPAYLEQESIKVFRGWDAPNDPVDPAGIDWSAVDENKLPYRFRQDPGPGNALGRVKFMFPNRYNVYLHDTPDKELFSRASRDFSSGCIRVREPIRLASYLLRDKNGWDEARILEAADRGVEQAVSLARSWPVHLLYWTAWVGAAGEVNFRRDIYQRDEKLAAALGH